MLIDKYKKLFLIIEDIYFAKELQSSTADIVRYIQYSEYNIENNKKEFNTNVVDLNSDIEDIQSEFRKSIKSELNQAVKNHNIKIDFFYKPDDSEIDNFCKFYNAMARIKNLSFENKNKIIRLKDNILLSEAKLNGETLVSHLYIFDKTRIRLLYSASLQTEDNELFKIVSKANKLLHFQDIKFSKDKQFKIYDFGGISLVDEKVAGIDQFKLGFSKIVEKSCHVTKGNTFIGKMILFFYEFKGKF